MRLVLHELFPAEPSSEAGEETATDHARHSEEIQQYLDYIEGQYESLPLVGFETAVRVPIKLEDLIIPLHAVIDLRGTGRPKFADASEAAGALQESREHEAIPLTEGFVRARDLGGRRGLVVLGDPGSGKTTLLKRLLLWLVRRDAKSLGLDAATVPVFLPLRDLSDLSTGLGGFLESQLVGPHTPTEPGFARRLLRRGKLLFLLDGLDEISDQKKRKQVSLWIEKTRKEVRHVFSHAL